MRPAEAIAELRRLGHSLELHGDNLLVQPRDRITEQARALIVENRHALIGQLQDEQAYHTGDRLAQRVADLADAYAERIAIVLEAGDIGEAEARRIAEAEIGATFVREFLSREAAA